MTPDRPTLLLIRGLGGPDGSLLARSLSGIPTVTLYGRVHADDERWSSEAPVLRRLGPVVEVPAAGDAITIARRAAIEYGVTGVVTFSELGLELSARISDRLGLGHHHSLSAVALMRDKLAQRRRLARHGVPVPRFAPFNVGNAARACDLVGFPAVLKPVHGLGSSHTYKVYSLGEALAQYRQATTTPRAWTSPTTVGAEFLLEEYLKDGEVSDARLANYVSVESATIAGKAHHFGITDRLPQAAPFREVGALAPSALMDPPRSGVLAMVTEALGALRVGDGITHTEVKLTPYGPRIIEVNGRIGGPIAQMYDAGANLDAIRLGAEIALGTCEQPRTARFSRHVAYWCPQSPATDVELLALQGIEEISKLPGVVSVRPMVRPPARMSWRTAGPGGGTLATMIATADSRDDLHDLLSTAQHLLRPVYSQ